MRHKKDMVLILTARAFLLVLLLAFSVCHVLYGYPDGGFRTEDILVVEKFAPELVQTGVGSYICSERNRVRQQKLVPQRVITD